MYLLILYRRIFISTLLFNFVVFFLCCCCSEDGTLALFALSTSSVVVVDGGVLFTQHIGISKLSLSLLSSFGWVRFAFGFKRFFFLFSLVSVYLTSLCAVDI